MINAALRSLYTQGRVPVGGPRSRSGRVRKILPASGSNPGPLSPQRVAILTAPVFYKRCYGYRCWYADGRLLVREKVRIF